MYIARFPPVDEKITNSTEESALETIYRNLDDKVIAVEA